MPLGELSLDQMLADPMVRLVMRRDGVEEAEIRALFGRMRQRRGDARPSLGAESSLHAFVAPLGLAAS